MFQSLTAFAASVREKIPAAPSAPENVANCVDPNVDGLVPHVVVLKQAPPPSRKIISLFDVVAAGSTPMPVELPSRHCVPAMSTHVHDPGVVPVIGAPGVNTTVPASVPESEVVDPSLLEPSETLLPSVVPPSPPLPPTSVSSPVHAAKEQMTAATGINDKKDFMGELLTMAIRNRVDFSAECKRARVHERSFVG
jgi:hypothetical protein